MPAQRASKGSRSPKATISPAVLDDLDMLPDAVAPTLDGRLSAGAQDVPVVKAEDIGDELQLSLRLRVTDLGLRARAGSAPALASRISRMGSCLG